ncbi:acyltransferase family protein [Lentzea kentuckyensis]|uniref:acyltransferase family protein n=1 Tax=Lentzea kentuckyensis TaxID=360086 RepID=UPI000A3710B7|nr:acyltransferase family protein [Lentzea kentuckyensis]
MTTTMQSRPEQDRRGPATGRRPSSADFRTDVQALRAIAVLAVVVNHFWPKVMTGGYVGVDVFFVISGYLITSHLDRELVRTGKVRLGTFYARRVRRLLPAAFLVLIVSIVLAWFLLPYPRWTTNAWEAFAAAFYWENWLLAAKSVNYSAQTEAASLVQHYWSLSVEEQFYLFWPLLLIGLVKLGGRRFLIPGIAVLGVLSLAFSVYYTIASPSEAYFITPVRVWEFAIGGVVALTASKLVLPRIGAEVAAGVGFAMILVSAFVYGHTTPFPGFLALVPTVGTALVIISGMRPGRQWHTVVTASAPVQFVGNISYSLYLWHWPVVVLAPFALRGALDKGAVSTPWLFWLLGVSFALAWLTKMYVEDRARTWPRLSRSTIRTFGAMIVGLALVEVLAGGLQWSYHRQAAEAEQRAAATSTDKCHGAGALVPANNCAAPFGPAHETIMGPANEFWLFPPECKSLENEYKAADRKTTTVCDYSGGDASAPKVWLVGDSHAEHWIPPMLDLAREKKWKLNVSTLGGCPFADVALVGYRGKDTTAVVERCTKWTPQMTDVIAADKPSMVFMSFFSRKEAVDDGSGRSQAEQYLQGLDPKWRKWTDAGARVFVFADPPLNGDVRSTECVPESPQTPQDCALPRSEAHPTDPLAEATRSTKNPGVKLIDFTKYFCDDKLCYAVIGGVAVYFDRDHLNKEYSRSLKPMIAEAIN